MIFKANFQGSTISEPTLSEVHTEEYSSGNKILRQLPLHIHKYLGEFKTDAEKAMARKNLGLVDVTLYEYETLELKVKDNTDSISKKYSELKLIIDDKSGVIELTEEKYQALEEKDSKTIYSIIGNDKYYYLNGVKYVDFSNLTNYIKKSSTNGLLKNDGTVDTTVYASVTDTVNDVLVDSISAVTDRVAKIPLYKKMQFYNSYDSTSTKYNWGDIVKIGTKYYLITLATSSGVSTIPEGTAFYPIPDINGEKDNLGYFLALSIGNNYRDYGIIPNTYYYSTSFKAYFKYEYVLTELIDTAAAFMKYTPSYSDTTYYKAGTVVNDNGTLAIITGHTFETSSDYEGVEGTVENLPDIDGDGNVDNKDYLRAVSLLNNSDNILTTSLKTNIWYFYDKNSKMLRETNVLYELASGDIANSFTAIAPEWVRGVHYIGDVVYYNGSIYRCLKKTAVRTGNPEVTPSYWTPIFGITGYDEEEEEDIYTHLAKTVYDNTTNITTIQTELDGVLTLLQEINGDSEE